MEKSIGEYFGKVENSKIEKIIDLKKNIYYCLRVTLRPEDEEEWGAFISEYPERIQKRFDAWQQSLKPKGIHLKSWIKADEVGETDNRHTHFFIEFNRVLDKSDIETIRRRILKEFNVIRSDYSFIKARNNIKASVYNSKDTTNLSYKGFSEKVVKNLSKIAYSTDKVKFMERMEELEINFIENNKQDIQEWIEEFVKLKVEYNQNISSRFIEEKARLLIFKKHPGSIKAYAKNLRDKIIGL